MKNIIIILLSVIVLTACELERSNNGKLDGNWKLTELDTLASSTTADMQSSGIFWAVQHHLLEIKNINNIEKNAFFRFEQTDATLRIYNPISDNKAISDSVITSPETLRPFGILHLDETLAIEQLSSSKMTLRNEKYRFHFKKF